MSFLKRGCDPCESYKLNSVRECLSASRWPQSRVLGYKILDSAIGADAVFGPTSSLDEETGRSSFLG